MPIGKVEIVGLAELRSALKAADSKAPKALQKANKAVAKRVADKVQQKYSRRYRSVSGKGQRSIRALATATKAQVALGSTGVPYLVGQNFGSRRFRQFMTPATPDYFLFRTWEEERDHTMDTFVDMLDEVLSEAFPKGHI
jgi:hypothetical protein